MPGDDLVKGGPIKTIDVVLLKSLLYFNTGEVTWDSMSASCSSPMMLLTSSSRQLALHLAPVVPRRAGSWASSRERREEKRGAGVWEECGVARSSGWKV